MDKTSRKVYSKIFPSEEEHMVDHILKKNSCKNDLQKFANDFAKKR